MTAPSKMRFDVNTPIECKTYVNTYDDFVRPVLTPPQNRRTSPRQCAGLG